MIQVTKSPNKKHSKKQGTGQNPPKKNVEIVFSVQKTGEKFQVVIAFSPRTADWSSAAASLASPRPAISLPSWFSNTKSDTEIVLDIHISFIYHSYIIHISFISSFIYHLYIMYIIYMYHSYISYTSFIYHLYIIIYPSLIEPLPIIPHFYNYPR